MQYWLYQDLFQEVVAIIHVNEGPEPEPLQRDEEAEGKCENKGHGK